MMERLADMQKQALEQKEAQQRAREALPPGDGAAKGRDASLRETGTEAAGAIIERCAKGPRSPPQVQR